MAAILGMAAIGAWAVLTERVSYVITHGVSMQPTYHADDLVVVVRHHSYEIGQIAAYDGRRPGVEVLHRVVGKEAGSYVLKGDNNQSIDAITPDDDEMIGRAVLHVPNGGIWLKPLLSPTGLGMLGFLFAAGGAATARTRREIPRGRRKKKVKAMARQGGSLATATAVVKAVRRLPRIAQAGAAFVVIAALLGVVLAVAGWMKPVLEVRRTAGTVGQSMTFSYSAAVPRSPAYDSTTVRSPDPVFRKLAHLVDIQMRYRGSPGTFDVSAELAAPSGWHTTMRLVAATKFTGNEHKSTTQIDLDKISERAKAAEDAIGIGSDTISIVITARVTAPDRKEFSASLPLQLSALQLGPGNGATFQVETSTPESVETVARSIWLSGMTAASARAWAVFLLFVAVGGTIGIFLATRRNIPLRTRTEIERRYPQLLVPVEPMASPPGKPVVNVDNFPALVKLAERYGQMILTWRRPEADDFVVRDEGITYRYRIPLDEPVLQNIEHLNRPASSGSHRRKASTQVS
jgi:hypothetical protein